MTSRGFHHGFMVDLAVMSVAAILAVLSVGEWVLR